MLHRSFVPRALAVLALASGAVGQVELEWDQEPQVPLPHGLRPGSAVPNPAGGWYLPASRMQFSASIGIHVATEALLLRYDASGALTGMQSLAPGSAGSHAFVADPTGGFWAALASDAGSTLRRYDAAGVQQVSIALPPALGVISAIGLSPSGDVHVGGADTTTSVIASWTPTGVQNFLEVLPQPSFNGSVGTVSPAGFVALARSGGPGFPRIDVVRPDGSVAWSTTIASTSLRFTALSFTPAGELVAVGWDGTFPTILGTVMKWSPTGTPSWTHTSAIVAAFFESLDVAPDGRIAVVGHSRDAGTAQTAALVARLDADGTHAWTNSWTLSGSSSLHRFDRVLFDAAGQIVVGGSAALNTPPSAGLLQSAPVIASWTPSGDLSWQFVGTSLHTEDICTALHETSTGSLVYSARGTTLGSSYAVPHNGRLLSVRPTSIAYCFGDGSGAACPCGNDAAPGSGTGCIHSNGVGGRLVSSGISSLTADTLVLQGSGMPGTTSALYFQATTRTNGGAGSVFGDGKLCATGPTMRLGTKFNSAGASQFPAAGDPSIHVRGNVTTPGARMYQVLYRNAAPFCTSAVFNLTNGVEILWTL